jgi:hypothetical protein
MEDLLVSTLTERLKASDEQSRADRARRLQFLVREYGPERWVAFTGGDTALRMFEEARDAYLNGQYCACLLLSHAVITQQLIGVFRESGRDDIAESGAEELYRVARDEEVISPNDFSLYNNVRKMRNAYVHPPSLSSKRHIARRAISASTGVREITAQDARTALRALFLMLSRPRFSAPG